MRLKEPRACDISKIEDVFTIDIILLTLYAQGTPELLLSITRYKVQEYKLKQRLHMFILLIGIKRE